jgi:hypothetical protein
MSSRGFVRALVGALTALVAVLALTLASAPAASADTASDAVTGLQTNPPMYVGDTDAVISKTTVIAGLPKFVRVAIMTSSNSGTVTALARQIGVQLDPNGSQGLVVAVVAGNSFGAASSRYCSGFAATKAAQAVSDHKSQLEAGGDHPDLTALVNDFGNLVESGPLASTCTGGTSSTDTAAAGKSSGSSTAWIWLVGILAVLGGGIGALLFRSRRKKQAELAEARAQIDPYLDRLANEVNSIDAKDNAVARQAMADASERYTSAGAQLQTATSLPRLVSVRQTVLQGLYAARSARAALGLDLGPSLPAITADGDQLTEHRDVTVQGQTFRGQPGYSANSPYYYGGGYGVPGGWYGTPFWETLLLTSVLTGGFGGFGFGGFGGGGYGAGYDSGYQAGEQAGSNDSSGGWGGGGGDWGGGGGGGGDWGGGGGGGDGGSSW